MTKFIIEQLRKENAFLNDMLENAHNRSRLLKQQLQQAQAELARYKAGVEVVAAVDKYGELHLSKDLPHMANQRVRVLVCPQAEVMKEAE